MPLKEQSENLLCKFININHKLVNSQIDLSFGFFRYMPYETSFDKSGIRFRICRKTLALIWIRTARFKELP